MRRPVPQGRNLRAGQGISSPVSPVSTAAAARHSARLSAVPWRNAARFGLPSEPATVRTRAANGAAPGNAAHDDDLTAAMETAPLVLLKVR